MQKLHGIIERPTLASRVFLFLLGYFQTNECEISDGFILLITQEQLGLAA